MTAMRLQKFLSTAGVCSRRKGEEFILAGRVAVNGEIITTLGSKIDPDIDRVAVDGSAVEMTDRLIYIALNKPRDYVTSCRHPGDRIVLDLVDVDDRIYPVGRLDKDSTGLLLLTNDGRIHHRLSHPSFDHEKEYEVTLARPISDGALRRFEKGLPILGSKTRPATVTRLGGRRFRIILQEGRNRQIRRMVQKVGNQVAGLKRIRVSSVRLGTLPEGRWRYLTDSEEAKLLSGLEPTKTTKGAKE